MRSATPSARNSAYHARTCARKQATLRPKYANICMRHITVLLCAKASWLCVFVCCVVAHFICLLCEHFILLCLTFDLLAARPSFGQTCLGGSGMHSQQHKVALGLFVGRAYCGLQCSVIVVVAVCPIVVLRCGCCLLCCQTLAPK